MTEIRRQIDTSLDDFDGDDDGWELPVQLDRRRSTRYLALNIGASRRKGRRRGRRPRGWRGHGGRR